MEDRRWKMGIPLSPISYLRSPGEAMISIQWNPEKKQLRQFAGIWFPAFCGLVGWMIGKKTGHWGAVEIGWFVCGGVSVAGFLFPPLIRPVFVGLILATFPIGWVVSHVLLPAITHVDYSARLQTVKGKTPYRKLLEAFERKTGSPVIINTSFNVRGEPIVCTAEEAYRCFLNTDMDALVIGNFLLLKEENAAASAEARAKYLKNFELD